MTIVTSAIIELLRANIHTRRFRVKRDTAGAAQEWRAPGRADLVVSEWREPAAASACASVLARLALLLFGGISRPSENFN
ncbi:hypothetical protein E2C01_082453 [Portunus trituberculatus]|uniref:Uncharacterized protein n=1 Tax=Portunus trituberculatus TaxID=210409 RepID=A0A5B7J1Q5_PORTR|nr:hypothetical protein [Portunus trituberculatus]